MAYDLNWLIKNAGKFGVDVKAYVTGEKPFTAKDAQKTYQNMASKYNSLRDLTIKMREEWKKSKNAKTRASVDKWIKSANSQLVKAKPELDRLHSEWQKLILSERKTGLGLVPVVGLLWLVGVSVAFWFSDNMLKTGIAQYNQVRAENQVLESGGTIEQAQVAGKAARENTSIAPPTSLVGEGGLFNFSMPALLAAGVAAFFLFGKKG